MFSRRYLHKNSSLTDALHRILSRSDISRNLFNEVLDKNYDNPDSMGNNGSFEYPNGKKIAITDYS